MSELLFYDLKSVPGVAPGLPAQISREIGRRIVAGHLPEGALIDDEARLAARYGVSKSVVREAVKLLAAKGLLDVRRGSGTRVKPRAQWALLDDDVLAWHQAVEPRPAFLRQLLDMRQVIEPSAAQWAAQSSSDRQVGAIETAYDRMVAAQSAEEFAIADALFHRAILQAANNEVLMAMEGIVFSSLLTSVRLTNADPRDNPDSIELHRLILHAIADRAPANARQAMVSHLSDTRSRLERIMAEMEADGRA